MMVNLSRCDSDVLSEVPYSDSSPNDMINQDVQEMQYSKQTHIDDFQNNEIHSDSNIITYSQYLQESQDAVIQDTNSSAPNDLLVLSLVEQMTDHVAHLDKENQKNKMVNESLTAELERYKEQQAFWLKHLSFSETPVTSHTPVRIEAPSELPKVLKDTFNAFDKTPLDEITEVQTIFNQIEAAVDQCSVDKNAFEIQIKQ
ncbi:hypothetical protein Tco_0994463, partial [Tanacetum coccineum]